MRIALLQCDVITGDLPGNASKIIAACQKAATAGAKLCAVPLQAIAGPEPDFFIRLPFFAAECRSIVEHMAKELESGPALICGHPFISSRALLLSSGVVVGILNQFHFNGHSIVINPMPSNTVFQPIENQVDMAIDLTAWSFRPGLCEDREKTMRAWAASQAVWSLSVNLVGGYDGMIYSGQSAGFDPQGRLWARGNSFAEDVVIIDTSARAPTSIADSCEDMLEAQWRALVLGVGDFSRKTGIAKAMVGLSGGMDSALVACIAAEALGPENVTGIMMPSPWTSESSIADASTLGDNLGINLINLPIENAMKTLEQILGPVLERFPAQPGDLTFENLQARIRGLLLMAAANRSGSIVLNTGNKSELAMGYCTLYGDTCGALAVLGDLLKTRVYELATWYCQEQEKQIIPQNIFDKAPSAELRPNQKDTDSLPPYGQLDPILEEIFKPCGSIKENKEVLDIAKRVVASRFKAKQCPPPILVSGEPYFPKNNNSTF